MIFSVPPGGPHLDRFGVGAQGNRGTGWFTGSGAPTTIPGSMPGDMYLDQTSGDVDVVS